MLSLFLNVFTIRKCFSDSPPCFISLFTSKRITVEFVYRHFYNRVFLVEACVFSIKFEVAKLNCTAAELKLFNIR